MAALANGAVDLLAPQGNALVFATVLQAEGGVPTIPSSIQVVSKAGGQLSVLVSSVGSDTIYVYAQSAASEGAGGPIPTEGSPSPGGLNFQSPGASVSNAFANFTASALVTATAASGASTSASTSASSSSASVSSASATSVGLSLGTFSSGRAFNSGASGTVLVSVEGNTYLSVPILDFGVGSDEEAESGSGRMPWLSGMFNSGDKSPLSKFIMGLDEALRDYRGLQDLPAVREPGSSRDPWSEDLFQPLSPGLPSRSVSPMRSGAAPDQVQPRGTSARGVPSDFNPSGSPQPADGSALPATSLLDPGATDPDETSAALSLAGILIALTHAPSMSGRIVWSVRRKCRRCGPASPSVRPDAPGIRPVGQARGLAR